MDKLILATVLAGLPIAAHAEERRLKRDGSTFVYRSEFRDGATILTGKRFPGGRDFRLVVKNGRVRGYSGGWPVAFALRNGKPEAALAAR